MDSPRITPAPTMHSGDGSHTVIVQKSKGNKATVLCGPFPGWMTWEWALRSSGALCGLLSGRGPGGQGHSDPTPAEGPNLGKPESRGSNPTFKPRGLRKHLTSGSLERLVCGMGTMTALHLEDACRR